MVLSPWLLFMHFALICIISPGPAVLLSVTNSLTHGFAESVYSSLGNVAGLFIVSAGAAFGLGALLQTSVFWFTTLKFIGAAYLVYLGIRQWRSKTNVFADAAQTFEHRQGKWRSFVQGVSVAVSNPKAVLFFTALFPQFVDVSRPVVIQFFILTITFMLFSFIVLVCYALCARSVKVWFAQGRRALWFNRVAGMIFITFGLGMLRLRNRNG